MKESGISDAQLSALDALLDVIIPRSADARMPGAGELGLAAAIGESLAASPEQRHALLQGLAGLDELARERGAPGFADLEPSARREVVDRHAEREPGFVPGLLFPSYAQYYQDPRVVEALGLEARPPYPKGYEMEESDASLLDPVRARGKLYRD